MEQMMMQISVVPMHIVVVEGRGLPVDPMLGETTPRLEKLAVPWPALNEPSRL
jgi:hypothetical protein